MVATINNHQDSGKHDALYARYSSHSQDDSTSIAVQIESCERMASRKLVHFIDQAKTGRTTGGRTELLRLIQEAEAGRIAKLYVYKFDRLGRTAETHVLVEDLERCGVEVVSVTEGTNARRGAYNSWLPPTTAAYWPSGRGGSDPATQGRMLDRRPSALRIPGHCRAG